MFESKKILIIGHVWPEPGSSAAGRRMMQLIDLFQSQGATITFASAAASSGYMADLESLGIDCAGIEVNSNRFDGFVREIQPAMVIFDRFMTEEQFGWRVAGQCPDALRILNTEDLHCLRRSRKNALKWGEAFFPERLLSDETARREIASIYRSDLSLIISEAEMKLLQSVFDVDRDLLHYLPFMLQPVDTPAGPGRAGFDSRSHFIHIGNFRHEPNVDSVLFMKKEIWPLIRRQLPDAELHLYGAYPTQKALDLHDPDTGFLIRGRAENAGDVVGKARVCLAPLRFGAGLKGKLVEAMEYGTPSVTTEVGAEGIAGDLPWSGMKAGADQPKEIAKAAVTLYTDRMAWQKAVENGFQIINERFPAENFKTELISRIINLYNRLEQHRMNNFTGAMLMHHTMASTRYMSRWIEAKNRSSAKSGKK